MRIKVVAKADGWGVIDPRSIRVLDAETGSRMTGVRSITFHADLVSAPVLRLEVDPSEIEIEADAEIVEANSAPRIPA